MAPRLKPDEERRRRKHRRASLGTLRENQIKPRTRARYTYAVESFFQWLECMSLATPAATAEFDLLVCDYLEHLWQEGDCLALAGDTLSGLTASVKTLKRGLPESWSALTTWQGLEPPSRAPPLWDEAACALVGLALEDNECGFAFSCMPLTSAC